MIASHKKLGGVMAFLVAALVCADDGQRESGLRREEQSKFKLPLDVTVDAKGDTARATLLGTMSIVTVDLTSGKIKEEMPWPENKRMPSPAQQSRHLERGIRNPYFDWLWEDRDRPSTVRGMTNARAYCMIPGSSGQAIFAHQIARQKVPTTQVTQCWVFTNAITQFEQGIEWPALLICSLDEPNQGYADPSDVVITPDNKTFFVASAGSDTILVVTRQGIHKYIKSLPPDSPTAKFRILPAFGAEGWDISQDLKASRYYVVAKLPTQANPRRLGLSGDGKILVVSNHLADSLTVIDAVNLKVLRHISLGGPKPEAVRRGEILFNSGKMTFQGQFTCASCHPNGHADGLVWDLERDGIGNYKKTKSLLGVKDTAPYGWHGSSSPLADRITGTLRTLHRHEPTKAEVHDLVAYLESLPPPSPRPLREVNREAHARGKALFHGKARCATCHQGDSLQDGKTHDVGSRGSTDTQDGFDTPSLRGVLDNGPYLHDGRAITLEEVFEKHNAKKRHGAADLLNKDELEDLMVYVKHL